MATKTCSKCLEEKSFEEFSKQKTGKFGFVSQCKACRKLYQDRYYEENKVKEALRKQKYYEENKEKVSKRNEIWAKSHRESRRKIVEKWRIENKPKKAHYQKLREAKKTKASPCWLTLEQLTEIENFYWLAKECEMLSGDKYHVDHIIPLQSKNVCGLHVPWNLQVLPADVNISKGNRL